MQCLFFRNRHPRYDVCSQRRLDRLNILNYYFLTFSDGFPVTYKILSIWFRVEFPGNNALERRSSPKIHPTDHMSTAFEYCVEPSKIYGALYHLVATYSVK